MVTLPERLPDGRRVYIIRECLVPDGPYCRPVDVVSLEGSVTVCELCVEREGRDAEDLLREHVESVSETLEVLVRDGAPVVQVPREGPPVDLGDEAQLDEGEPSSSGELP